MTVTCEEGVTLTQLTEVLGVNHCRWVCAFIPSHFSMGFKFVSMSLFSTRIETQILTTEKYKREWEYRGGIEKEDASMLSLQREAYYLHLGLCPLLL